MQTDKIKISLLSTNTGQIAGLPKNPRLIKDDRFKKLVQSLKDDPEMMELREIIAYDNSGELVVICGNMRLKALQELGEKEAFVKVLPKETPVEKLQAYTIKDNIPFGEHDWDVLKSEWDGLPLVDWGLELPEWDFSGKNKEINTDDFADEMIIKLKYTEADYLKVKEQLSLIASTPEAAVWKLLGNE